MFSMIRRCNFNPGWIVNHVCRRRLSVNSDKSSYSSRFAPVTPLSHYSVRQKSSSASPSLAASASTTTATDSKKIISSKRGPKFRTPSKLKDASEALGVERMEERLPSWNIWAYATADEYQMEQLSSVLRKERYEVSTVAKELTDVLRVIPMEKEQRFNGKDIFVFRDGAVVFWDMPKEERSQFLLNLRPFESRPFDPAAVEEECERLIYVSRNYDEELPNDAKSAEHDLGVKRGRFREEVLYLDAVGNDSQHQLLERYTVSNVMAASVQLSMWESDLERLASSLEEVTQAMNEGRISLHKKRAISYAGRLISLRHNVSLHSDLLDHPDFYWERVGLEKLYDEASQILCLRRRVSVFNKKIDDAMALIDLIMQELTVTHSARLEWLIIYLICIEVRSSFTMATLRSLLLLCSMAWICLMVVEGSFFVSTHQKGRYVKPPSSGKRSLIAPSSDIDDAPIDKVCTFVLKTLQAEVDQFLGYGNGDLKSQDDGHLQRYRELLETCLASRK